ncbi:MAG: cytochrome ubiquinol oxidase subunit I [Thermoguttaceae bacterium]|jgi:cytochrome bd-type quinol oxidase subunit 1|nr:cytochrome ubiquinol oxidase subunit I [Thermoguttaceae bacterium]
MEYPWWYVPHLTSPMLIAAIAVVHVLVSHYAVGGGLFLAVETRFAYQSNDTAYLDYLRRHARFFILLTVVWGAITGVGIWWTIGLASPTATEVLIRTFVFGWATEYVFFVLEILAAFAFYYYWGRLSEKVHVTIGWIYAAAAWISLVLITGITAFMLNPGGWPDHRSFWVGFLNPQFVPQTIARTGGALLLSSLYVYLHASLVIQDRRLYHLLVMRSARPALWGAVLITVGGIGWFVYLPESARAALESAAVLTVLVVIIFALTAVVFVLLYLGPYRNPGWMSPGFALALCLFGVAAFSTGEFVREAVRKPYVIYNVVLGNQIAPEHVQKLRRRGFLEANPWTKAVIAELPAGQGSPLLDGGRIDERALLERTEKDPDALRVVGQALFQYHCNDCHALERGYSAVGPMIRGRDLDMNFALVKHLEKAHFFMPPWAGTEDEALILARYLTEIAPPRPRGMDPIYLEKQ